MVEQALTPEQEKWLKSLKRCLNKMAGGIEILVQEYRNAEDGIDSSIHLFAKGEINRSQTEVDDLANYDPGQFSLVSFVQKGVAANNHGY